MATERTGPMSPAAVTLLEVIRDISEERWAAAWRTDLEFMLWDLAHGRHEAVGHPWPGVHEDAVMLRRLSEMCDGWWAWDDDVLDVVFVPLPEWRTRMKERAHT